MDKDTSLTISAIVDPAGLLPQVALTALPNDIAGMADGEPILQGYLKKGTDGNTASWRRRWFVLSKTSLSWRKSQTVSVDDDGNAKEAVIQLSDVSGIITDPVLNPSSIDESNEAKPDNEKSSSVYSNCFQLIVRGHTLILQAPLEAAKKHWLTAIAATMVYVRRSHIKRAESVGKGGINTPSTSIMPVEVNSSGLHSSLPSPVPVIPGNESPPIIDRRGSSSSVSSKSNKLPLDISVLADIPLDEISKISSSTVVVTESNEIAPNVSTVSRGRSRPSSSQSNLPKQGGSRSRSSSEVRFSEDTKLSSHSPVLTRSRSNSSLSQPGSTSSTYKLSEEQRKIVASVAREAVMNFANAAASGDTSSLPPGIDISLAPEATAEALAAAAADAALGAISSSGSIALSNSGKPPAYRNPASVSRVNASRSRSNSVVVSQGSVDQRSISQNVNAQSGDYENSSSHSSNVEEESTKRPEVLEPGALATPLLQLLELLKTQPHVVQSLVKTLNGPSAPPGSASFLTESTTRNGPSATKSRPTRPLGAVSTPSSGKIVVSTPAKPRVFVQSTVPSAQKTNINGSKPTRAPSQPPVQTSAGLGSARPSRGRGGAGSPSGSVHSAGQRQRSSSSSSSHQIIPPSRRNSVANAAMQAEEMRAAHAAQERELSVSRIPGPANSSRARRVSITEGGIVEVASPSAENRGAHSYVVSTSSGPIEELQEELALVNSAVHGRRETGTEKGTLRTPSSSSSVADGHSSSAVVGSRVGSSSVASGLSITTGTPLMNAAHPSIKYSPSKFRLDHIKQWLNSIFFQITFIGEKTEGEDPSRRQNNALFTQNNPHFSHVSSSGYGKVSHGSKTNFTFKALPSLFSPFSSPIDVSSAGSPHNALKTPSELLNSSKNGILLAALIEHFFPNEKLDGITSKTRVRAVSLSNCDKALSIVRPKGFRQTKANPLSALVDGRADVIGSFLGECYDFFALKQARIRAKELLAWLDWVLSVVGIDLDLIKRIIDNNGELSYTETIRSFQLLSSIATFTSSSSYGKSPIKGAGYSNEVNFSGIWNAISSGWLLSAITTVYSNTSVATDESKYVPLITPEDRVVSNYFLLSKKGKRITSSNVPVINLFPTSEEDRSNAIRSAFSALEAMGFSSLFNENTFILQNDSDDESALFFILQLYKFFNNAGGAVAKYNVSVSGESTCLGRFNSFSTFATMLDSGLYDGVMVSALISLESAPDSSKRLSVIQRSSGDYYRFIFANVNVLGPGSNSVSNLLFDLPRVSQKLPLVDTVVDKGGPQSLPTSVSPSRSKSNARRASVDFGVKDITTHIPSPLKSATGVEGSLSSFESTAPIHPSGSSLGRRSSLSSYSPTQRNVGIRERPPISLVLKKPEDSFDPVELFLQERDRLYFIFLAHLHDPFVNASSSSSSGFIDVARNETIVEIAKDESLRAANSRVAQLWDALKAGTSGATRTSNSPVKLDPNSVIFKKFSSASHDFVLSHSRYDLEKKLLETPPKPLLPERTAAVEKELGKSMEVFLNPFDSTRTNDSSGVGEMNIHAAPHVAASLAVHASSTETKEVINSGAGAVPYVESMRDNIDSLEADAITITPQKNQAWAHPPSDVVAESAPSRRASLASGSSFVSITYLQQSDPVSSAVPSRRSSIQSNAFVSASRAATPLSNTPAELPFSGSQSTVAESDPFAAAFAAAVAVAPAPVAVTTSTLTDAPAPAVNTVLPPVATSSDDVNVNKISKEKELASTSFFDTSVVLTPPKAYATVIPRSSNSDTSAASPSVSEDSKRSYVSANEFRYGEHSEVRDTTSIHSTTNVSTSASHTIPTSASQAFFGPSSTQSTNISEKHSSSDIFAPASVDSHPVIEKDLKLVSKEAAEAASQAKVSAHAARVVSFMQQQRKTATVTPSVGSLGSLETSSSGSLNPNILDFTSTYNITNALTNQSSGAGSGQQQNIGPSRPSINLERSVPDYQQKAVNSAFEAMVVASTSPAHMPPRDQLPDYFLPPPKRTTSFRSGSITSVDSNSKASVPTPASMDDDDDGISIDFKPELPKSPSKQPLTESSLRSNNIFAPSTDSLTTASPEDASQLNSFRNIPFPTANFSSFTPRIGSAVNGNNPYLGARLDFESGNLSSTSTVVESAHAPPSSAVAKMPSTTEISSESLQKDVFLAKLLGSTGSRLVGLRVKPLPGSTPWDPPVGFELKWGPGAGLASRPKCPGIVENGSLVLREEAGIQFPDIASMKLVPSQSSGGPQLQIRVTMTNPNAAKDAGGRLVLNLEPIDSSAQNGFKYFLDFSNALIQLWK